MKPPRGRRQRQAGRGDDMASFGGVDAVTTWRPYVGFAQRPDGGAELYHPNAKQTLRARESKWCSGGGSLPAASRTQPSWWRQRRRRCRLGGLQRQLPDEALAAQRARPLPLLVSCCRRAPSFRLVQWSGPGLISFDWRGAYYWSQILNQEEKGWRSQWKMIREYPLWCKQNRRDYVQIH